MSMPPPPALKRPSGSQGGSKGKRARHEPNEPSELSKKADAFNECLADLRELGLRMRLYEGAVSSIVTGLPPSTAALNILNKVIEVPTESPSKDLLQYIELANMFRSSLAELYHSELEASTVQSNHGETDRLIKERQKAIEDGTNAPAPSDAAKLSGLSAAQANYPMKIGRPFETTGPPVSIYHPVFSKFQARIQDPNFRPKPEDIVTAFDLIETAAKVYPSEYDRVKAMKGLLGELLDCLMGGPAPGSKLRPDGVVWHRINRVAIPLLVMEAKNEISTDGSDPDIEGSFSFRKLWTDESLTTVQNVCCCPSFILSMAGPNITIHGGVLATEFIVQPLTEMLKLANFPDPYGRAEYIAKIMAALRTCLNDLEGFYRGLTLAAKEQPARFSPFFQEYDGFALTYTSPNLLSDRIGRAMFNAKVKRSDEEEGSPVKVKFTPRYCKEAHTLLAEKKLAPKLRHFKELENGWKVVVMDSVAGPDLHSAKLTTIPPRALNDVKEAVSMLHKENWVFGDLRRPNIMLCERDVPSGGTEQGAMLVDFDWVGKDGKQRYPPGLNTEAIQWPAGVEKCGIMRKEHDVAMLQLL